ncbi:MAG: CPBP family intramembrane metalloprotease [Firmicutes bacterium]|jgi:membrane protease YdiL (CAAX protease family)|nr:CPBP family intramembrane metalloprotease [Bacillota bacterium]MDH7495884.1 CPBP family intramembrane metalloprotease [Bacillota bacterium]
MNGSICDVERLDTRRITIYLAFSFGIAWAVALAIYLTGGLYNSPPLIKGTPFTLALVLLSTGYMWAPALAHILTRVLTREGWNRTLLVPDFGRSWRYWVAAWVGPGILTVLGAAVFFALFPGYFDKSLSAVKAILQQAESMSGRPLPLNPWAFIVVQTIQAILIAPVINGLFTFGEEFGWRAYLQPKLMPLGARKALFLTGLIWGVWHWPVIAMGHNYGLSYRGAPWLGMLAMVWFTLMVGTFLGWTTLRAGSVWPAVIGHGAINGIAQIGMLFVKGTPNPLLGPMPVGIIGSLPWVVVVFFIVTRRPSPKNG